MRLAFALLALALMGPLALGDHVYSHRVVVEGRLVGVDGAPIAGREVNVTATGDVFADACGEQENVTDAWGDFSFCYHKHEVEPGAAFLVEAGAGVREERAVDLDLRRLVFLLQDANATGVRPDGWNETFHVGGRVWNAGRVNLDHVPVNGVAVSHEPVNITLVTLTRRETNVSFTDAFGDFGSVILLDESEDPADAQVTARTRRGTFDARLDPLFHRTVLDILSPQVPSPLPGMREPMTAPPGTSMPPVSGAMLALVAAGIAASLAWAAWRKKP